MELLALFVVLEAAGVGFVDLEASFGGRRIGRLEVVLGVGVFEEGFAGFGE